MSAIDDVFERCREEKRAAFIPYLTAGDPDLGTTQDLVAAIEESGADLLELGVPFSDPLADGPVIQASAQRALKSGTTLKKIIAVVREIRQKSQIPIILMTSYNPVWVHGPEKFIEDARDAGVDGVIIPDLPPEEAEEFETQSAAKELDLIYLLAPTSTPQRVEWIGGKSRGFIYYVSLTGTTGVREGLAAGVAEKMQEIKKATPLPVLIGFGISNAENAREAAGLGDGVIVGSAIVRLIGESTDPAERLQKVRELVGQIRQALN